MDKYIYTCHRNIVIPNSSNNVYSAPHNLHIYECLYKIIKQMDIRYDYYTNTHAELI